MCRPLGDTQKECEYTRVGSQKGSQSQSHSSESLRGVEFQGCRWNPGEEREAWKTVGKSWLRSDL